MQRVTQPPLTTRPLSIALSGGPEAPNRQRLESLDPRVGRRSASDSRLLCAKYGRDERRPDAAVTKMILNSTDPPAKVLKMCNTSGGDLV
ncbi:hypothetical protein H4R24_005169 [Coemansia sp. RSA 988]|nr:hypothetical protein H4R24_005169 [Coemansia sp. RSA 988]